MSTGKKKENTSNAWEDKPIINLNVGGGINISNHPVCVCVRVCVCVCVCTIHCTYIVYILGLCDIGLLCITVFFFQNTCIAILNIRNTV